MSYATNHIEQITYVEVREEVEQRRGKDAEMSSLQEAGGRDTSIPSPSQQQTCPDLWGPIAKVATDKEGPLRLRL